MQITTTLIGIVSTQKESTDFVQSNTDYHYLVPYEGGKTEGKTDRLVLTVSNEFIIPQIQLPKPITEILTTVVAGKVVDIHAEELVSSHTIVQPCLLDQVNSVIQELQSQDYIIFSPTQNEPSEDVLRKVKGATLLIEFRFKFPGIIDVNFSIERYGQQKEDPFYVIIGTQDSDELSLTESSSVLPAMFVVERR
ncbi:MAG: hypothetical protein F6K21_32625 [Symploca sp. SIO2D2]|nr:hypothetical protein [Symploca sp. SIO2D2]